MPAAASRSFVATALAACLALGMAACGDDGDSDASGATSTPTTAAAESTSSSTAAQTTASTAADTTAPPATDDPPTSPSTGTGRFPTAEEAAFALFDAWTAGNELAARDLAPDSVVDRLFATDGAFAAESYVYQGCFEVSDPDPELRCSWSYEGGAQSFVMGTAADGGFEVVDLVQIAD